MLPQFDSICRQKKKKDKLSKKRKHERGSDGSGDDGDEGSAPVRLSDFVSGKLDGSDSD